MAYELCELGCTAIAYEEIQEPGGEFPLLAPMSRIAGQLSVHLGSVYLLQQYGGKGLLLGEDVRRMSQGSVIVDIAIDQGGCVETSHPTTFDAPIYVEEGVVHCSVRNLPVAVSQTASCDLSEASLPYVERIAQLEPAELCLDPMLKPAICIVDGHVLAAP